MCLSWQKFGDSCQKFNEAGQKSNKTRHKQSKYSTQVLSLTQRFWGLYKLFNITPPVTIVHKSKGLIIHPARQSSTAVCTAAVIIQLS